MTEQTSTLNTLAESFKSVLLDDICAEKKLLRTDSEENLAQGLRNMIADPKVCNAIASLIWACSTDN